MTILVDKGKNELILGRICFQVPLGTPTPQDASFLKLRDWPLMIEA